jgi:hypothetical protein
LGSAFLRCDLQVKVNVKVKVKVKGGLGVGLGRRGRFHATLLRKVAWESPRGPPSPPPGRTRPQNPNPNCTLSPHRESRRRAFGEKILESFFLAEGLRAYSGLFFQDHSGVSRL